MRRKSVDYTLLLKLFEIRVDAAEAARQVHCSRALVARYFKFLRDTNHPQVSYDKMLEVIHGQ